MDPRLQALLAIQKGALALITPIDEVCGGNFDDLPKPIAALAYSLEANEETFANGGAGAIPLDPATGAIPATLGAFAARLQPVIDALSALPPSAA